MLKPLRPNQYILSVPLKSLKVDVLIENSLSSVTITQVFTNTTPLPIECEYEFPLEKESVVTSLNIVLPDGTILKSSIEEIEKAQETYQDSLSQGNSAALAQRHGSNFLNVLIGNIGPSDSIKTQIVYVSPLSLKETSWNLEIPSGFIPTTEKSYNVQSEVLIKSGSPITSFNSTWNIQWDLSENKQLLSGVFISESSAETNFNITYTSENVFTPSCTIQSFGGKRVAMASFIPLNKDGKNSEFLEGTGEFLFLIDRSGSMSSLRIKIAKDAAILFLKSLPSNSKFNIISFGSNCNKLFPQSLIGNSENINNTISLINSMDADMGGTDICSALTLSLEGKVDYAYPRTIFLLTDGGDSYSDRSLKTIKEKAREAKVYTFGIQSNGKEKDFLIKASIEGKGSAFFVEKLEDLGKNVIQALSKCVMPCMNNWEINWKGKPVPEKIGTIYYGERFIQYILLDNLSDSLPEIKYFDTYEKREVVVTIDRVKTIEGDGIFKLWAKNYIEEIYSEGKKEEVIEISKEYQVLSPVTGFVCIKENSEIVSGDIQTIKIPIKNFKIDDYSSYIGNIPNYSGPPNPGFNQSSSNTPPVLTFGQSPNLPPLPNPTSSLGINRNYAQASQIPNELYFEIIKKQNSEGYWEYRETILIFSGSKFYILLLNQSAFSSVDFGTISNEKLRKNIISTLFILSYLKLMCSDKTDELVLIRRKSANWLGSSGIDFNLYSSQFDNITASIN